MKLSKAAYRIREAAEIASVTEADITDAIKTGRLTARRIRDTYVITHSCVLEWLDSLPEFYATETAGELRSSVPLRRALS